MKYFYKDVLAVYWMKKHFNMNFESPNLSFKDDVMLAADTKFYIADGSLHLLEQVIGDVVITEGKPGNDKIIYRNGNPFMWPEAE